MTTLPAHRRTKRMIKSMAVGGVVPGALPGKQFSGLAPSMSEYDPTGGTGNPPPVERLPGGGFDLNQAQKSLQMRYPSASQGDIASMASGQIARAQANRAGAMQARCEGGSVAAGYIKPIPANRTREMINIKPLVSAAGGARVRAPMQQQEVAPQDPSWTSQYPTADWRRNIRVGNVGGRFAPASPISQRASGGVSDFWKLQGYGQMRDIAKQSIDPTTQLSYAPTDKEIQDQMNLVASKGQRAQYSGYDQAMALRDYYNAMRGGDPDAIQRTRSHITEMKKAIQAEAEKSAAPATPAAPAATPSVAGAPVQPQSTANTPAQDEQEKLDTEETLPEKDQATQSKATGGDTDESHPYLVNEEGMEAYQPDGEKPQPILGGPQVITFPKDGKVIPHKRTMQLLRSGKLHLDTGGPVIKSAAGEDDKTATPVDAAPKIIRKKFPKLPTQEDIEKQATDKKRAGYLLDRIRELKQNLEEGKTTKYQPIASGMPTPLPASPVRMVYKNSEERAADEDAYNQAVDELKSLMPELVSEEKPKEEPKERIDEYTAAQRAAGSGEPDWTAITPEGEIPMPQLPGEGMWKKPAPIPTPTSAPAAPPAPAAPTAEELETARNKALVDAAVKRMTGDVATAKPGLEGVQQIDRVAGVAPGGASFLTPYGTASVSFKKPAATVAPKTEEPATEGTEAKSNGGYIKGTGRTRALLKK